MVEIARELAWEALFSLKRRPILMCVISDSIRAKKEQCRSHHFGHATEVRLDMVGLWGAPEPYGAFCSLAISRLTAHYTTYIICNSKPPRHDPLCCVACDVFGTVACYSLPKSTNIFHVQATRLISTPGSMKHLRLGRPNPRACTRASASTGSTSGITCEVETFFLRPK